MMACLRVDEMDHEGTCPIQPKYDHFTQTQNNNLNFIKNVRENCLTDGADYDRMKMDCAKGGVAVNELIEAFFSERFLMQHKCIC